MLTNPEAGGGLRFLRRILTHPHAAPEGSTLEAMLVEAELSLVEVGETELDWSALLAAAEAYWRHLPERDQQLVGTSRDILNRWGLNGGYFLEIDESRNRLRIHTSA